MKKLKNLDLCVFLDIWIQDFLKYFFPTYMYVCTLKEAMKLDVVIMIKHNTNLVTILVVNTSTNI